MRSIILAALLLTACADAPDAPDADVAADTDPLEMDNDGDGVTELAGDCDDTNASTFPGGLETCDNLDNDCDGEADDGYTLTTWYADADGDGYAGTPSAASSILACLMPDGYAPGYPEDCDDADPDYSPATPEVCDGLDQNCDGSVDEGLYVDWWVDSDGDGYGYRDSDPSHNACKDATGNFHPEPATIDEEYWPRLIDNNGDCDERSAKVHPGATEACNGIDDDCDGVVDDSCI